MINNLGRILTPYIVTPPGGDENEPEARCSRCRSLWPLSELENGLCRDCRMEDDADED